jgi:hypothetical protein
MHACACVHVDKAMQAWLDSSCIYKFVATCPGNRTGRILHWGPGLLGDGEHPCVIGSLPLQVLVLHVPREESSCHQEEGTTDDFAISDASDQEEILPSKYDHVMRVPLWECSSNMTRPWHIGPLRGFKRNFLHEFTAERHTSTVCAILLKDIMRQGMVLYNSYPEWSIETACLPRELSRSRSRSGIRRRCGHGRQSVRDLQIMILTGSRP